MTYLIQTYRQWRWNRKLRNKPVKRINILYVIIVICLVACLVTIFRHHNKGHNMINDKDLPNSLPDPDRAYYDGSGNKYKYNGEPILTTPIDYSNWGK